MGCKCQVPVPKYPANAEWGPILWTVLHGIAEKAGKGPLPSDEQRAWQKFIALTGDLLPCEQCRNHYKKFNTTNLIDLSGVPQGAWREKITKHFWLLHNEINLQAKKPAQPFDTVSDLYKKVNFQDYLFRLEPIMKKTIELNGLTWNKWTNWVAAFKYLRSCVGVM